MAVDWNRGYTSTFRVYEVDRRSWGEAEEVGRIESASIDRVADELLESASLKATQEVGAGFRERYLRVVMEAEQDGSMERVEVATLLCASTEGEADKGADTIEIEGRSVLYPASTRNVHDLGVDPYAPMGADGAEYAATLLGRCIAAPVSVEGSFTLGRSIVHDLDASYLDAAWDVLDYGGFTMRIDGHGTVHIARKPSEPPEDALPVTASVIIPGVSHSLDMSEIPNRYIAVMGAASAVSVNDDPDSETSTVTRGYYVDKRDTSPKLLGGESLAEYARRKLVEESVASDTLSFKREYRPDLLPNDVADYRAPSGGLDGRYRITRQSLALGRGIQVDEEVVEEVSTWQG